MYKRRSLSCTENFLIAIFVRVIEMVQAKINIYSVLLVRVLKDKVK